MKRLKTEQDVLLQLVKKGIETANTVELNCSIDEVDWEELLQLSVDNAVHLLTLNAAAEIKDELPAHVKQKWMSLVASTLSYNFTVLEAQNELTRLLEENSIKYVILKGTAAASYYPDYEKRCFGDVDFLINPIQKEEVGALLSKNGYECVLKEYVCHSVFVKDNVEFEMHYDVVGIPGGEIGNIFRDYLVDAEKRGFDNKKPEFKNPNPELHAIILLLHTIHHLLDEGIGLRHLCDWACFVNETQDDVFWQEQTIPLLKATGTLKFASVLTETASIYLGTACPDWVEEVDNDICHKLICDILQLGNFGNADKTRSISGKMITSREENRLQNRKKEYIKEKFSSLYTRVKKKTKHKVFVFPVYLFELTRTCLLMLCDKKISIAKTARFADERNKIYEEFDLYITK